MLRFGDKVDIQRLTEPAGDRNWINLLSVQELALSRHGEPIGSCILHAPRPATHSGATIFDKLAGVSGA
jgi:hypothetical protein